MLFVFYFLSVTNTKFVEAKVGIDCFWCDLQLTFLLIGCVNERFPY